MLDNNSGFLKMYTCHDTQNHLWMIYTLNNIHILGEWEFQMPLKITTFRKLSHTFDYFLLLNMAKCILLVFSNNKDG